MTDPTAVQVRRARPTELDVAGAVTAAAYAPFTVGPDDAYLEKLRDAAARDREAELWVAVVGDRVVGCVTACPPGSPWRELAGPEEGEFRMLAVDPTARGLGIGAALVERCEERARAHGARGMVLSSLHEMADAHRLYGRLGYRRDESRDWEPVPGVALVAFVKNLT